MTNIIAVILASSCFGVVFAEYSGIPNTIKKWLMVNKIWYKKGYSLNGQFVSANDGKLFPRRIKPFDCSLCLSFWICLFLIHFKADQLWIESVGYSCVSATLSIIIIKATKP